MDPVLLRRALKKTGGRSLADRLEFLTARAEDDVPDPEAIERARETLRRGGLLCVFAEGRIPRSGKLLRFSRAFETIAREVEVPVVPVAIHRPWGSLVELRDGRARWNRRRLRYPVTIRFGEALAPPVSAFRVRRAVQELQATVVERLAGPNATLPHFFLRAARRYPTRLAAADSMGRNLRFFPALAGALALRRALRAPLRDSERVGVLLPPSVAALVVNLALAFLGKVAVNLNYTLASDTYRYCVDRAKLRKVITSRKFLARLGREESDLDLCLEDIAPSIGLFARLRALAQALFVPAFLLRRVLSLPTDPKAPVAVLFSSGSTGAPKGVVLSHQNIISNIQGMHQLIDFRPEDRIVGVLPFFHAFGYTVTFWFPLVAGYGAIYHPDPRDAKSIARLMDKWRATIIVSPPTFFQIYLRQWPEGTGKTLRIAMAGAEKLKSSLAETFQRRFGFPLFEGYGATELSPTVSFNTFDFTQGEHVVEVGLKPGSIGHPLPGVAVKAVGLDDGRELEAGEEGLLCVKGPNVMLGYLDDPEKTAEAIVDGWYQTGDIGRIDEDGFIEITDRLSRFSKLGGEMVPHVRIESELQDEAPDIRFAVTALPCERKGEKLVVLHTPLPRSLSPDGLRERLRLRGVPNLFLPRSDCFVEVVEIPLLASGKLDLRALRSLAEERLVGSRSEAEPSTDPRSSS